MKKILITGGHIMPALAVIDELIREKKSTVEIVFVGRQFNLDSDSNYSLEYKEIQRRGIRFIHLKTGKYIRQYNLALIKNLLKIIFGLIQSWQLLKKERPDYILSFGGYLGWPIVFIGRLINIPCFIHEQTIKPGLANRLSFRQAKKVFLSFPQPKQFGHSHNVLVTGDPVRQEIFSIIKKPMAVDRSLPVIYVTGGSLGSHSINQLIAGILNQLLEKYQLIHQTGSVKQYRDYDILYQRKIQLPKRLQQRYWLREHFFSDEIGYIYSVTDLVISRAGANTFFELVALAKPAILIPLPWSGYQEQLLHAKLIKQAGAGEIFFQSQSGEELLELIDAMMDRLLIYKNNYSKLQQLYHQNASRTIIEAIFG